MAADTIRRWREHPAAMAADLFGLLRYADWHAQGEPDVPHLDAWQDDTLELFPHKPLIAMSCCKGPGKTFVIAVLCWNFLLCYLHCKIGAVSISGGNLKAGLWAEMAKLQGKSNLLKACFTWTAKRIFCNEAPETWFMEFRTWEQNADQQSLGDTLAGLWADNVMNVIDEAGGVPVAVLRTAEVVAAQSSKPNCSGHVILAGNTTSTNGALYEAVIRRRHLWHVVEVTADPDDPLRTPRIPKEYAAAQIAEYGRDNPWVMINILGKFPKQGINTFISPDEVMEAQKRHYHEHEYVMNPITMGVDIARFGDDETIFWFRQGRVSFNPLRMRNVETTYGVSHMLRMASERKAANIQLDMGNTGSAWYDIATNGMQASNVLGVHFGGQPKEPKRFKNKRAEMLWDGCEHIKAGGLMPPIPEMVEGLSTMTYCYTMTGQIQVEEKSQIKARLGRSPDLEDAFMCTFAYPVMVMPMVLSGLPEHLSSIVSASMHKRGSDYDPYEYRGADL